MFIIPNDNQKVNCRPTGQNAACCVDINIKNCDTVKKSTKIIITTQTHTTTKQYKKKTQL